MLLTFKTNWKLEATQLYDYLKDLIEEKLLAKWQGVKSRCVRFISVFNISFYFCYHLFIFLFVNIFLLFYSIFISKIIY